MLLEKVSIHTEILFVHCYNLFLLLLVLFLCLLKIAYYCLKVYMNLLCSCVLYMYGFDFFTILPRFLSLVIKGQFFSQNKILFQSAFFFFIYKNVASKSFYKSKIHPFLLMLMHRNEM